jgi:hypothetical protein
MTSRNRLLWQFFSSQAAVRGIIMANMIYWLSMYTYYYLVAIDFLAEDATFWYYWIHESSYLGWPLLTLAVFMGIFFNSVWDYLGP